MKKLSVILFAIFISSMAIQAKPKKNKKVEEPVKPKVELATELDSASYALGVYMGAQCAQMLSEQDFGIDLFLKGFEAAITDAPLLMNPETTLEFLNAYEKRLKERENAQRIADAEAFFAENAKREGVFQTESGLQYQVVKMGDGAKTVGELPFIDE